MPRLENASSYANASIETILNKAREVIEHEVERNPVLEASAQCLEDMPHFRRKEIVVGRVVGRGGFCVVKELNEIRLTRSSKSKRGGTESTSSTNGDPDSSGKWSRAPKRNLNRHMSSRSSLDRSVGTLSSRHVGVDTDIASREFLARRVLAKQGGKFVIKQVEPELLNSDRVTFLKGIIDLAMETKYLASLDHPNILKLRGVSWDSPYRVLDYFLVLDHLRETLPKKLNSWMLAERATKGITGFMTGGKRKATGLLTERILVAYDIAVGMAYIHSQEIIYRDLKPDNIGFDSNGTLKIFDMGLAKALTERDRDENGLYRLTGLTGAIRYMGPEVGLRRPYNKAADVYSWSMLMWYILALEPPMGLYTPRMFIDKVFKKGSRPAVKERWPERLRTLMRECWDNDIFKRPTFVDIMKALRDEMASIDPQVAATMDAGTESAEGSLPPERRLEFFEVSPLPEPRVVSIETPVDGQDMPVSPLLEPHQRLYPLAESHCPASPLPELHLGTSKSPDANKLELDSTGRK